MRLTQKVLLCHGCPYQTPERWVDIKRLYPITFGELMQTTIYARRANGLLVVYSCTETGLPLD